MAVRYRPSEGLLDKAKWRYKLSSQTNGHITTVAWLTPDKLIAIDSNTNTNSATFTQHDFETNKTEALPLGYLGIGWGTTMKPSPDGSAALLVGLAQKGYTTRFSSPMMAGLISAQASWLDDNRHLFDRSASQIIDSQGNVAPQAILIPNYKYMRMGQVCEGNRLLYVAWSADRKDTIDFKVLACKIANEPGNITSTTLHFPQRLTGFRGQFKISRDGKRIFATSSTKMKPSPFVKLLTKLKLYPPSGAKEHIDIWQSEIREGAFFKKIGFVNSSRFSLQTPDARHLMITTDEETASIEIVNVRVIRSL